MKRLQLILFILISLNVFSQDTVILKTGEVIPCRIGNISNSGVVTYYYVNSDGDSVMAQTGKALCYVIRNGNSVGTVSRESFMQEVDSRKKDKADHKLNYRSWIDIYTSSSDVKGDIYEIKDSSITVYRNASMSGYSAGEFRGVDLHIDDIETIKVRRKGGIGRGCLFGSISGFAIGALIGFATHEPSEGLFSLSAGGTALGTGILFLPLGASVGAVIGSGKIEIPINGSMATYNREKNNLKKYSLK